MTVNRFHGATAKDPGKGENEMGRKHWTTQETKAVKAAIVKYKEENQDWRQYKRDKRKAAYFEALHKELPERSLDGIETRFNELMGSRDKRGGYSSVAKRGSDGRRITRKGLSIMRENGRRQMEVVRENLRAMGLSEEDIKKAFTRRRPKVSQEVVAELERRLAHAELVPAVFRVQADGTVCAEFKERAAETPQEQAAERQNGVTKLPALAA